MKPLQLVRFFGRLNDEQTTPKPSGDWTALKMAAASILKSYQVQLAYVQARADFAIRHNEEPERTKLFTKRNLKHLADAAAINGEINQRLKKMKKSKRGATTKGKPRKAASSSAGKRTRAPAKR